MEANTRGGICSFLNDCLCGLMLVCCACDGDWYAVDVGCVGARFLGRLGILWCQVGYWFVCCFGRHLGAFRLDLRLLVGTWTGAVLSTPCLDLVAPMLV